MNQQLKKKKYKWSLDVGRVVTSNEKHKLKLCRCVLSHAKCKHQDA